MGTSTKVWKLANLLSPYYGFAKTSDFWDFLRTRWNFPGIEKEFDDLSESQQLLLLEEMAKHVKVPRKALSLIHGIV
jgi:hypothetical protein